MSTKHLLAEELHPLLDTFPELNLSDELLPAVREAMGATVVMGDPEQVQVDRREITTASADGTDIRCLVYTPRERADIVPGYLHVHGGGYILGTADMSDIVNLMLASKLGIVIVSVDYRLAPEYPIPLPLDDCYAGLAWLHNNAAELGVDRSRIAIGGESAGGGLAAALGIKARDLGEYDVCHQHLTYPMLDDRTGTPEQPGDPLTGEFVWTREANQYGWTAYLADVERAAPQVPARVETTDGLPSTWMFTAGLDLFRDENIHYAQRLMASGVPTELVVYPGACHGFQGLPGTKLAERFVRDHMQALGTALGVEVKE